MEEWVHALINALSSGIYIVLGLGGGGGGGWWSNTGITCSSSPAAYCISCYFHKFRESDPAKISTSIYVYL